MREQRSRSGPAAPARRPACRRPCRATPARPASRPTAAPRRRRRASPLDRPTTLATGTMPSASRRHRARQSTRPVCSRRARRARRSLARHRAAGHLAGDAALALARARGRSRPRRRRAISRASRPPAAIGWKPSGNSSAMKPVESLPARQRGCCISAERNGMLWRMPSMAKASSALGLRRRSRRRASARG